MAGILGRVFHLRDRAEVGGRTRYADLLLERDRIGDAALADESGLKPSFWASRMKTAAGFG